MQVHTDSLGKARITAHLNLRCFPQEAIAIVTSVDLADAIDLLVVRTGALWIRDWRRNDRRKAAECRGSVAGSGGVPRLAANACVPRASTRPRMEDWRRQLHLDISPRAREDALRSLTS